MCGIGVWLTSLVGLMVMDASHVCWVAECVLCCGECDLEVSRCLGGEEIVFVIFQCLAIYVCYLSPVVDWWCVFGGLGFSII